MGGSAGSIPRTRIAVNPNERQITTLENDLRQWPLAIIEFPKFALDPQRMFLSRLPAVRILRGNGYFVLPAVNLLTKKLHTGPTLRFDIVRSPMRAPAGGDAVIGNSLSKAGVFHSSPSDRLSTRSAIAVIAAANLTIWLGIAAVIWRFF